MTLVPKQLFLVGTETKKKERIFPRENGVRPGNFAAGTALLPIGTPVAVNSITGKWVPFFFEPDPEEDDDDTDTIRGFVYPEPIQLVAGGEVTGQILRAGDLHGPDILTDEILAVLGGSPDADDLRAALLASVPSLRELNLELTGVVGVK